MELFGIDQGYVFFDVIPNRYQDKAAFRKERLVSSPCYVVKLRSARNVLCFECSIHPHKAFLPEHIKYLTSYYAQNGPYGLYQIDVILSWKRFGIICASLPQATDCSLLNSAIPSILYGYHPATYQSEGKPDQVL